MEKAAYQNTQPEFFTYKLMGVIIPELASLEMAVLSVHLKAWIKRPWPISEWPNRTKVHVQKHS